MRDDLVAFTALAAKSKITVPLLSVCRKLSSSDALTERMRAESVINSGY